MEQNILSIIKNNIEKVKKLDTPPDNYFLVKNNIYSIQANKNFNILKGNGFLFKNFELIGLYDFEHSSNKYNIELFLNGTTQSFDHLEEAVYYLWEHRKDNNDVHLL